MQTAYINGKPKQIPENWSDIKQDKKLLLYVVSLFFKGLTKDEILTAISYFVFKIGPIKQNRIGAFIEKNPTDEHSWYLASQLARMAEALEFIVNETINITENLFPVIFRFRKFHCADSILSKSEIWEFALCENDYFKFAQTQEIEYLDKLISKIYRPKKSFLFIRKRLSSYEGDIRVKFSENSAKRREKRIKKLNPALKWLIYRWFASQRELIVKAHKYTYKNSEGKGSGGTWADTIIALSEVGTEDRTAKTKLAIILRRIDNENKKADEAEKRNKRHKV